MNRDWMPGCLQHHFDAVLGRCAQRQMLPTFIRKLLVALYPTTYRRKRLSDLGHEQRLIIAHAVGCWVTVVPDVGRQLSWPWLNSSIAYAISAARHMADEDNVFLTGHIDLIHPPAMFGIARLHDSGMGGE